MIHCLVLAVLVATPADEVRAALADLRMVAAVDRPTTRYVTLHAAPPEEWDNTTAAVSYVLNAVSRSPAIVRPIPLCGGRLLRIDLRVYGLPADVWELLVADGEPYFHITTKVLPPGAKRKTQTVFTDGGWVDLAAAAELRALSHSTGAIVRADWFVTKVSQPPHYYRFAAVSEDRDGWYRDLGIDPAAIVRLRANRGANIIRSGVTRHVRRVSRWQGPFGGAWQTYDVSESRPGRDPIRAPVPGDANFKPEAGELIAAKANGLHLFGLYDAAGRRQDAVPDIVAKDDSDPHGDGVIRPLLSCVRCHVEDGLRSIRNDQRALLQRGVVLFAESPDLASQLAEFYTNPKFDRDLGRDREDYAAAVERATGLDGPSAAAALAAVVRAYQYNLVTPEQAARELGLPAGALPNITGVSDDPAILALAAGIDVQREQWEASFAQAALLGRGIEN
jgi:hypothetical protein